MIAIWLGVRPAHTIRIALFEQHQIQALSCFPGPEKHVIDAAGQGAAALIEAVEANAVRPFFSAA